MLMRIRNIACMCAMAFGTIVQADTLEVPSDYPSIQAAIDVAVDGDVVLVAPGNYTEAINFNGKRITVESSDGPDVTGIKPLPEANQPSVTFAAKENASSRLIGFKIGGGTGSVIQDPIFGPTPVGGGVFCYECNPQISNCYLVGNVVDGFGAGMAIVRGNPVVSDCLFDSNSAGGHGGGLYVFDNANPTISNCTFRSNEANWGGGITCTVSCDPILTNCFFEDNLAANVGGGIFIRSSSSPRISGATFRANRQSGNPFAGGAGVTIYGSGNGGGPCYPTFDDCLFEENQAMGYGGAVHAAYAGNPTFRGCMFEGNASDAGGGGISAVGNDKAPVVVEVVDCVFEANSSPSAGGAIQSRSGRILVSECVIEANEAKVGGGCSFENSPQSSLADSDVCGNTPDQVYGLFTDDGGNNISDVCNDCPADLSGDGMVDAEDLGLLLVSWNLDGPADLNGDGEVNSADVGLLLAAWGMCF